MNRGCAKRPEKCCKSENNRTNHLKKLILNKIDNMFLLLQHLFNFLPPPDSSGEEVSEARVDVSLLMPFPFRGARQLAFIIAKHEEPLWRRAHRINGRGELVFIATNTKGFVHVRMRALRLP